MPAHASLPLPKSLFFWSGSGSLGKLCEGFPDGDERTLRRSAVTVMGPQHFQEGQTLGAFPLIDPDAARTTEQADRTISEVSVPSLPSLRPVPLLCGACDPPVMGHFTSVSPHPGGWGLQAFLQDAQIRKRRRVGGTNEAVPELVSPDDPRRSGIFRRPQAAFRNAPMPTGSWHEVVLVNPCPGEIDFFDQFWWPALVRALCAWSYLGPNVQPYIQTRTTQLIAAAWGPTSGRSCCRSHA